MALPMNKLYKRLLKNFSFQEKTNQLKIYHKNMFNYPKNQNSMAMKFENHTIINKNDIDRTVEKMLTSSNFKNCRVIHPYLLGLSWNNIKGYFNKKYCKSSQCYEIIPKKEYEKTINYRSQTRETIKIVCLLLENKLLKNNFPEYYNYLFSDRGITVEEKIDIKVPDKKRYIDIKFSFDEKINIFIEINEKHHDKARDKDRAIEIFSKTNTMPIMYYQEEEDMTNLMPKIYLEFCYAIAKTDILQALKFYLIIIDNLDPFFVNFAVDNMTAKRIEVSEINDTLKETGMTQTSKYIKTLLIDGLLDDDDIDYEGQDVMSGNVSPIGCDLIFMRLENKYFKGYEKQNLAQHLCKQYAIIKQKYFKTLQSLLTHQQNHFKIIYKSRNELEQLYQEIKPVNLIIQEMVEILYPLLDQEKIKEINQELEIELHPKHLFLVRQDNNYIESTTFKKITKKKYHETEETSNNIVNYRWMKLEEWELIKEIINQQSQ